VCVNTIGITRVNFCLIFLGLWSDTNDSHCLVDMYSLRRLEMGSCGALIGIYSLTLTVYLTINVMSDFEN
jgi:hypothetical protein